MIFPILRTFLLTRSLFANRFTNCIVIFTLLPFLFFTSSFINTYLLVVVLKWSRSSTANISYSSVTKSIFDTKLYRVKVFLCFNKNHLHNNISGLLGLTLTTIMPLKPNLTGLYSNTTKNMINCQLLDCQIPRIHFLRDFFHACHLAIISLTIPLRSKTMKVFLYHQQCHKPNQTPQASQNA